MDLEGFRFAPLEHWLLEILHLEELGGYLQARRARVEMARNEVCLEYG